MVFVRPVQRYIEGHQPAPRCAEDTLTHAYSDCVASSFSNGCGLPKPLPEAHHMLGTNIDTGRNVAIKIEHVSIGLSLLEGEADPH